MGSSSGESQSTTTQNLTPEQQQLVSQAMGGFNQFAGSATPTLPGGQGIAGFTPAQVQGQQMTLNAAGQMQPVVNTAAGTNQYISSGAFLDPGSNPYVTNMVNAATQPIYQNLNQSVLPQDQAAAASGSGVNYGNTREGVKEALDTTQANTTAGNVAANIEGAAQQAGLTATNQAIAQAPTTAQSLTLPGATTSAVGDVQQQQQQNVLNADQQAMLENWLLPLMKGQALASGAAGLPGGSTSSTGQTTQQAAPWQIAAGLMAGAGSLLGGGSKLNLGSAFMGGGSPTGL